MDDSSSCLSVCVYVYVGGVIWTERERLKVEIEKQRESRRGSGTELKSHEYVFREVEKDVPRVFFRMLVVVYRLLTSLLSIIKYISLHSCLSVSASSLPSPAPASPFLTIILPSFIYICQAQTSLHKERT